MTPTSGPHSALRTSAPAPTMGSRPWFGRSGPAPRCGQPVHHPSLVHIHQFCARIRLCIADNHTRTHHWCTPMKTPGRHHPAGHDLSRGHIGRGASTRSHDDASCGAKVEYRTSSTPAYTDELDLHYSTNSSPTKTRGRPTLRIVDNKSRPHDWCAPMNYRSGPHSALRTTGPPPMIDSHPRIAGPGTPRTGTPRTGA